MTRGYRTTGLVRMALMGAAFVGLTIVLIVFQPGSPRKSLDEDRSEPDVTRAAPALQDIPVAPEPDLSGTVVLIPETGADAIAAQPFSAPVPATGTDSATTLRDVTFAAISNLKSVIDGEAPAPGEPGSLLHSVVQRSIAARPVETGAGAQPEPVVTRPVQRPVTQQYFVRAGETLSSIAQEVYGDANRANDLFLNNTDVLARPDSLRAGMILDLP